MKAPLQELAKKHPGAVLSAAHDITITETHRNIILNPALTPADFGP